MRGITTYSRGGFLGAGSLGVIALLRAEKKIRMAVAIAALGLLVWNVMPRAFWDRMNTITVDAQEQRDDSAAGRLHFWNVALDMAKAKPYTGVGLNAFNGAYLSYNTDAKFPSERAAHSIWFGVLGDLGYPGLVLFVGNLTVALWSCWRVVRMTRRLPEFREMRVYANALISTLIVYAVTGTFLSHQYNEMAWHMFGLSTALYLVTVNEMNARRAEPTRRLAA
jgi:probable O-glycosylation ligase (exosortase A-associated)